MELWIARDVFGNLTLFEEKPVVDSRYNWIYKDYVRDDFISLDRYSFPEVTWENSPKKVRIELIDE